MVTITAETHEAVHVMKKELANFVRSAYDDEVYRTNAIPKQVRLADYWGIQQTQVSSLLRGHIRGIGIETLARIAKLYGAEITFSVVGPQRPSRERNLDAIE